MGQTAYEDQKGSISEGSLQPVTSTHGSGKGRKRALTGFGFAMLIVLVFAIFCWENLTRIQVSGRSMFPTFHDGQQVVVCKAYWLIGPIRDKDVVVLKDGPTGHIIKRVFRMGGEVVDWKFVPYDYLLRTGPFKVPEGQIYVLGDNLPESEDSRVFGPRPLSDVIGKVIVRQ